MNDERRPGLQHVKAKKPEARYWRVWGRGGVYDEDTANALTQDGFLCVEQQSGAGYRLVGTKEAAEKWPELFRLFRDAPKIVPSNPESENVITRDFYTMEYEADYYSKPGIRPSEAEMMAALHGLFSEYDQSLLHKS